MAADSLQQSINTLFALVVYVPINLLLLAAVWAGMAFLNRLAKWGFAPVTIALAAGLLVLAFDFYWLDEINSQRGWVSYDSTPSSLYVFTAVMAGLNAAVIGLFSWIFKKQKRPQPPPLPGENRGNKKARTIGALVWLGVTLLFFSLPFVRAGGEILTENRKAAQLVELDAIIERGDAAAFRKEAETTPGLWALKLPSDPEHSLFEVLLARNKTALAEVLVSANKELFTYSFDYPVQSPEMADMLVAQGMPVDQLVMEVVDQGSEEVVRHLVKKHHPPFRQWVDLTCMILLRDRKETLLKFLAENGLARNAEAVAETTAYCASRNDFEGLQRLEQLGFVLNPADARLPGQAVQHNNLPMLEWLMGKGFDVNGKPDEYTLLENAIVGDHQEIFEYLLTLNPEMERLHTTQLNGETNALRLAERYQRPAMQERLRAYLKTSVKDPE